MDRLMKRGSNSRSFNVLHKSKTALQGTNLVMIMWNMVCEFFTAPGSGGLTVIGRAQLNYSSYRSAEAEMHLSRIAGRRSDVPQNA